MSRKMPPVPPDNRSRKGPGSDPKSADAAASSQDKHAPINQAEQDRHGNVKQNTTHQGYQQDR